MTLPFSKYAQIKDKYCICYLGPSSEFVEQLKMAREVLEQAFPGVYVYLCCRDSLLHLLEKEERVLPHSLFDRKKFGYVKEMKYNLQENPVEAILKESGITVKSFTDLHTKKDVSL